MILVEKKWQTLPIIILSFSMLIGLYGFYVTLEKLVVENERDHLVSLMSDVVYEVREDSRLFSEGVDVDDYIGNLTQASTRLRIQVTPSAI
ncbi:hypothetical protein VCRA2120E57_640022 [Vibrio crassostreae]|nr:hypothetical protein VCRA2120E57_640022 [Vibrio crassostreae]